MFLDFVLDPFRYSMRMNSFGNWLFNLHALPLSPDTTPTALVGLVWLADRGEPRFTTVSVEELAKCCANCYSA